MTKDDKSYLTMLILKDIEELEESQKLEKENYDPEYESDKWISYYEEKIINAKRLINELKGEL